MKKVIPVRDFIVLKRSINNELRIHIPDSVDKGTSSIYHYNVVDIGPDVKSVKCGDSVVTSAGLFKTEVDGQELYFTKEELVCLIVREENE